MSQIKKFKVKKHVGDKVEQYCDSGLAKQPYEWAKYFERVLREGAEKYYDKFADKQVNQYPRTMDEIVKNVNNAYININNESQRLFSHLFSPSKTWLVAEPVDVAGSTEVDVTEEEIINQLLD